MWGQPRRRWNAEQLQEVRDAGSFSANLHSGAHDHGALKLHRKRTDANYGTSFVEFAQGDQYFGGIVSGLKHGKGTYIWANGAKYEGEWRRNVPHGDGHYEWPDGERYEGSFSYGRRNGAGMYTFANGSSFVGTFKDDKAVGKGICTLAGGRSFHGDYALFSAYLQSSELRRQRATSDKWPAIKWGASSDLMRNPPWTGFTAVRSGERHRAFQGSKPKLEDPILSIRTFSLNWPEPPFSHVEALDLEVSTRRRRSSRMPTKKFAAQWPFVSSVSVLEDDVDATVSEEADLSFLKVGAYCECQLLELETSWLGREAKGGKVILREGGCYMRVRIEVVEVVWPGFTESEFPLVLCKVKLLGLGNKEMVHWVPGSRLRPCMAEKDGSNGQWQGWIVKNSPCGEYKDGEFSEKEEAVKQGSRVECLFPVQLMQEGAGLNDSVLLFRPSLVACAAESAALGMIDRGDPTRDGMWVASSRDSLKHVPLLLAKTSQWDILSSRVLGSVVFLSLVVKELGPEALCDMFDECYMWMLNENVLSSCAVVEVNNESRQLLLQSSAAKIIQHHRFFVHWHREQLRKQPLAKVAEESRLEAHQELFDRMFGVDGTLQTAKQALKRCLRDREMLTSDRLALLGVIRGARHLKSLHFFKDRHQEMDDHLTEISNALARFELEPRQSRLLKSGFLNSVCKSKASTSDVCSKIDSYSLLARHELDRDFHEAVVQIELNVTFRRDLIPEIAARVIQLLHTRIQSKDVKMRLTRAEPSFSTDLDFVFTRSMLYISIYNIRDPKLVCEDVVRDFFSSSSEFSQVCRDRFLFFSIKVIPPSMFVHLLFRKPTVISSRDIFLELPRIESICKDDLLRAFPSLTDKEIADTLSKIRLLKVIREDLCEGMELSRDVVRAIELSVCQSRATFEIFCEKDSVAESYIAGQVKAFCESVYSGESKVRDGAVLSIFEYVIDVKVEIGFKPVKRFPRWHEVDLQCLSSGADTHNERLCLAKFVVPALSSLLNDNRVSILHHDLQLNGFRQTLAEYGNPLSSRAGRALEDNDQYQGSRTRVEIIVLGGDSYRLEPQRKVKLNTEPGCDVRVKFWRGDVNETIAQIRPSDRTYPQMAGEVALVAGVYSVDELLTHLEAQLTAMKWTDGEFEFAADVSKRWIKWDCSVDDDGKVKILLLTDSFLRFELQFVNAQLMELLGFDTSSASHSIPSSACVRQPIQDKLAGVKAGYVENVWSTFAESHFPVLNPPNIIARRNHMQSNGRYSVKDIQHLPGDVFKAVFLPRYSVTQVVFVRKTELCLEKNFLHSCSRGVVSSTVSSIFGMSNFGSHRQVFDSLLYDHLNTLHLQVRSFPQLVPYDSLFVDVAFDVTAALQAFYSLVVQLNLLWSELHNRENRLARVVDVIELGGCADDDPANLDYYSVQQCYLCWKMLQDEYNRREQSCVHGLVLKNCLDETCKRLVDVCENDMMAAIDSFLQDRRNKSSIEQHPLINSMAAGNCIVLDTFSFAEDAIRELYGVIRAEVCKRGDIFYQNTFGFLDHCRPFVSHSLERARQHELLSLLSSFYALDGVRGSRDQTIYELTRMTFGPNFSLAPLVFVCGKMGSGKSVLLARFVSNMRSASQDGGISSNTVDNTLHVFYFRQSMKSLNQVFVYLADELAFRNDEYSFPQPSNGISYGTFDEMLTASEMRFLSEMSSLLFKGINIKLYVDGLDPQQLKRFNSIIVHVYSNILLPIRESRNFKDGPSIQFFVTCCESSSLENFSSKVVDLSCLDKGEVKVLSSFWLKKLIPQSWIMHTEFDHLLEEILRVTSKRPTYPLHLVYLANEVSIKVRELVFSDKLWNKSLRKLVGDMQLKVYDDLRLHLLSKLKHLEKKLGYLTVKWLTLHLIASNDELHRNELQRRARDSLQGVKVWRNNTTGKEEIVYEVRKNGNLCFIMQAISQEIIWNHYKDTKKRAEQILSACFDLPGVIWCSDVEIDTLLMNLRPFLSTSSLLFNFNNDNSESPLQDSSGSPLVVMSSLDLRKIVIGRYDAVGSLKRVQEELVLLDRHGVGWDGLNSWEVSRKSWLNESVAVPKGIGEDDLLEGMATLHAPSLPADARAPLIKLRNTGSLLRSLDDDYIWHLHKFGQVLSLLPGLKIEKKEFVAKSQLQAFISSRFLHDDKLLCVFSPKLKKTNSSSLDLTGNGNVIELESVSDVVLGKQSCFAVAIDPNTGEHIPGSFAVEETDDLLNVAKWSCNFTCRTSVLSHLKKTDVKHVSSFAAGVDFSLIGKKDIYLMTGGSGVNNLKKFTSIRSKLHKQNEEENSPLFLFETKPVQLVCREFDGKRDAVGLQFHGEGGDLWKRSKPWFSVRIGSPLVIYFTSLDPKTAEGMHIEKIVVQNLGTIHLVSEGLHRRGKHRRHAHFFHISNYLQAIEQLRANNVAFTLDEHLNKLSRSAVTVWLLLRNRNPALGIEHWCYTFQNLKQVDLFDRRWHSLFVSVANEVLLFVDGDCRISPNLAEDHTALADSDDFVMSMSNYYFRGCFSGYFNNLVFYERSLSIQEGMTMTRVDDLYIAARQKQESKKEAEVVRQQHELALSTYTEVLVEDSPRAYWTMQEADGSKCFDHARGAKDKKSKEQDNRDLTFESRHDGGILKGDKGPPTLRCFSVSFQGGAIRGKDGEMCDQRLMKGRMQQRFVSIELRDLTIETWIRRNVKSFNPSETILSSSNEANTTDGDFSWFLDSNGCVNFQIVGHQRAVGPCPVGRIDDLEWHHIAVVRTSDAEVVNNWLFYKDGQLVWSTRHDGIPVFHPFTNLLIGKQHGEFWGGERRWKAGVGDPTCLQGNLCHLAVYTYPVRPERIQVHSVFEEGDNSPEIEEKASKGPPKPDRESVGDAQEEVEMQNKLALARRSDRALTVKAPQREKFTTRLWNRTNVFSAADVSSFYESLQQNNIWKQTRRMFSPTISGENFRCDDAVGKSLVAVHPPASFASSLARNQLEECAQSMIETCIKMSDPEGLGLWNCASHFVLEELPRLAIICRRWKTLGEILSNLCFLIRSLVLLGLENVLLTFERCIHAMNEQDSVSDEMSAAKVILNSHRNFLIELRSSSQRGKLNKSQITDFAIKRKLPSAQDIGYVISDTMYKVQRILGGGIRMEMVTQEQVLDVQIEMETYRQRLVAVEEIGLLACGPFDDQTFRSVLEQIDEWKRRTTVPRDSLVQLVRSSKQEDRHRMNTKVARFVTSSAAERHHLCRSHIRVLCNVAYEDPLVQPVVFSAARLANSRKERASTSHVIRAEPFFAPGAASSCLLIVLDCVKEDAQGIMSDLRPLPVELIDVSQADAPTCFLSFFLDSHDNMDYSLANRLQQARIFQQDLIRVMGVTYHPHILVCKGNFVLTELLDSNSRPVPRDNLLETHRLLLAELANPTSRLLKGEMTGRVRAIKAFSAWLPHHTWGSTHDLMTSVDIAGPAFEVMTCLGDLVPERRLLNKTVLPTCRQYLKGVKSELLWADLCHGGSEQVDWMQTDLRSFRRGAFMQSSLPIVGEWLDVGLAISLLGQNEGVDEEGEGAERSEADESLSGTWLAFADEERAGRRVFDGLLLKRSRSVLEEQNFQTLPRSAQSSMACVRQEAEWDRKLQEAEESVGGARCKEFASRILGYSAPIKTILKKLREWKKDMIVDLQAQRAFYDSRDVLTDNVKLFSNFMTRASEISIRQRLLSARQKRRLMSYWLLLKEHYERNSSLKPSKANLEDWAEIQELLKDPFLLSLERETAAGGFAGILDGDGFRCPEHGNAILAAHGLQVDCAELLVLASELISRTCAAYTSGQHWSESDSFISNMSFLKRRERQVTYVQHHASHLQLPEMVVDNNFPPHKGMLVYSPSEGRVGEVVKEAEGFGIRWLNDDEIKVSNSVWKSAASASTSRYMPRTHYTQDRAGEYRVCTPNFCVYLLLRRAVMDSLKHEGQLPVILLKGDNCTGKTVIAARLVLSLLQEKHLQEPKRLISFLFVPGGSYFFSGALFSFEQSPSSLLEKVYFDICNQVQGAQQFLHEDAFLQTEYSFFDVADVKTYYPPDLVSEHKDVIERRKFESIKLRFYRLMLHIALQQKDRIEQVLIVFDGVSPTSVTAIKAAMSHLSANVLQPLRKMGLSKLNVVTVMTQTEQSHLEKPSEIQSEFLIEKLRRSEKEALILQTLVKAPGMVAARSSLDDLQSLCKALIEKEDSDNVMYLAIVCRRVATQEQAKRLVCLQECPLTLRDVFLKSVVHPLEIRFGRHLIQAFLLCLLCCPEGIPVSDCKQVLQAHLSPYETLHSVAVNDLAFYQIVAELKDFLAPLHSNGSRLCFKHDSISKHILHYYSIAKFEERHDIVAKESKKEVLEVDNTGYVFIPGQVWSKHKDEAQVQLEVQETSDLSIIDHPLYHIRVLDEVVQPVEEYFDLEPVEKPKIRRSLNVPVVPKGVGQAWPFLQAPDLQQDQILQRPLLSVASHSSDDSHYRSSIFRGFPSVPEKRYSLSPFSAQSNRPDRWSKAERLNPGPPSYLYPSKPERGIRLQRVKPTPSLTATHWSQPGFPPTYSWEDEKTEKMDPNRERVKAYMEKRKREVFGK